MNNWKTGQDVKEMLFPDTGQQAERRQMGESPRCPDLCLEPHSQTSVRAKPKQSTAGSRPWGGVGRIIVGGHEGVREKGPAGKVLEMHTGNLVSLGLSIQLYLCC